MNDDKKREIWIDVLRAFACVCVLLIHSPVKYDGQIPGQYVLAPSNYILMSWGVSIFFMISGALLFSREQEMVFFYKKRFTRILSPLILWSIIYVLYEDILNRSFSWNIVFHKICLIPFAPQTGHLWFMYVLIGLYLIAPILSTWTSNRSKKDVKIVLLFWSITLLLPYLKIVDLDVMQLINENGAFYHYYGFCGYALLGYYLRKYIDWPLCSLKYILLVVFSFAFPICIFATKWLPVDVLNTSMCISSVTMSASAFLFFKRINYVENWLLMITQRLAYYSFGIYLSHMIFLIPIKSFLQQFHIHYLVQMPITAVVVGLLSLFSVWLISKIKISKYLIG